MALSAGQFELVRAWFDRLCDTAPEAQAAGLATIGDAAVRAEVESLLGASARQGGFLEPAPAAPGPEAGRCVGPWRLTRLLGRGGMGDVWLGERADGRFERAVAVKFLRPTLLAGLAAGRFEEETRILSQLDHPGIARLLDAGVTPAGEAYLITEFVDGLPLGEWVRRHRPSLRARLRLFARLAEAVEFAHRALVVHRDLKPDNVLVTAGGRPKLLDFGLARFLRPGEVRDPSVVRAFTPAYASPERIEGRPFSTATDVFSLGILFYELVGGRHPFRREGADERGTIEAILRDIPPPPSQSAREPGVRGDLDCIALRALEKAPQRRYASVREMREDVVRHLSHHPIRARAATLLYRLGKWTRRESALAALACLVLLAVGAGALALEAQRRREFAERARLRALALTLAEELIFQQASLAGPAELRLGLLSQAERALAGSSPEPAERARLELQLARAYHSLGRPDLAPAHLQAALPPPTPDTGRLPGAPAATD